MRLIHGLEGATKDLGCLLEEEQREVEGSVFVTYRVRNKVDELVLVDGFTCAKVDMRGWDSQALQSRVDLGSVYCGNDVHGAALLLGQVLMLVEGARGRGLFLAQWQSVRGAHGDE